jgi:molybdopterin molybdotransferase
VEEIGDTIRLSSPISVGACVRPAGQDVQSGETVLRAGTTLDPARIALLAAIGAEPISVVRRPVVAILSTGDELVSPGQPLRPGQIYNSNTPMLAAAVIEAGGIPDVLKSVPDDVSELRLALRRASEADLILTSGGASVGDFDFVKEAIGAEGSVAFWRVRVRPGKPLIFGSVGRTPLTGLPGNPTSAMVTFELFVRPHLRAMLGAGRSRPEVRAIVDQSVDNRGGRRTFVCVRLEYRQDGFHALPAGSQDSAVLSTLSRADGLLVVSEHASRMPAGTRGTVLVLRLPAESQPD